MNFKEGEVLYFNKPLKWTSFALVAKVRYHISRKIKVKKIKVGHAGTLDPLATGLKNFNIIQRSILRRYVWELQHLLMIWKKK